MNLLRMKTFLTNFRCRNPLTTEVFLYVLVGLAGTVVDFGIFFLSLHVGFGQLTAQWSAALFGFLHNHLWHHFFVFKHQERLSRTTSLSLIFSIISIIASGPALLFLQKIYDNFIFNKIVVLGITMIVLFCFRKIFVFKNVHASAKLNTASTEPTSENSSSTHH